MCGIFWSQSKHRYGICLVCLILTAFFWLVEEKRQSLKGPLMKSTTPPFLLVYVYVRVCVCVLIIPPNVPVPTFSDSDSNALSNERTEKDAKLPCSSQGGLHVGLRVVCNGSAGAQRKGLRKTTTKATNPQRECLLFHQ